MSNILPTYLYTEGTDSVKESIEKEMKKEDPETLSEALATLEANLIQEEEEE